ncbi:MAG: hypothetical protein WDW21_06210 [Neisseriaceae bacterium]
MIRGSIQLKKTSRKINKSEKILATKYRDIKAKCRKETIHELKEDMGAVNKKENGSTINSLTADCVEYALCQYGWNLK